MTITFMAGEISGYLSKFVKFIWFNSSRLITQHFNAAQIPENNILLADDFPQTSGRQGK